MALVGQIPPNKRPQQRHNDNDGRVQEQDCVDSPLTLPAVTISVLSLPCSGRGSSLPVSGVTFVSALMTTHLLASPLPSAFVTEMAALCLMKSALVGGAHGLSVPHVTTDLSAVVPTAILQATPAK